ncbi:MAG: FecR domain-containing protein [Bacteroidota bacterium]
MEINRELISKYLRGQCSESESQHIKAWLESEEGEKAFPRESKLAQIESEMWKNISGDMDNNETAIIPLYKRVVRYAAAVIILCAVGFSVYYFSSSELLKSETRVAELYQTVKTQRGEKRTVTLPDGSTIRMNYETEVKVPKQLEGDERVVYLTGQAHFDVVRNPEKPFIVYTDDTKTRVLGTSFDINTKKADETEIIVTSGKVSFSEKGQPDNLITLTVNDRAVLKTDQRILKSEIDAQKFTAWKENKLVFDGETLQEVIQVIEPWYDIKVMVKDPDKLQGIYKFSYANPSLQELFERLSFMAKFDYTIDGKTVTIL